MSGTILHMSSWPLLWHHNGRDSVSNHQPRDCFLNRLFRRISKQAPKLRVTGLCAGNSPGTGEFPAQMAGNAANVSIWWRHHTLLISKDMALEWIDNSKTSSNWNSFLVSYTVPGLFTPIPCCSKIIRRVVLFALWDTIGLWSDNTKLLVVSHPCNQAMGFHTVFS